MIWLATALAAPPAHWEELPEAHAIMPREAPLPEFPPGEHPVDERCLVVALLAQDGRLTGPEVSGCAAAYAEALQTTLPSWRYEVEDQRGTWLIGTEVRFRRTRRGKASIDVEPTMPYVRQPGFRDPHFPAAAKALDAHEIECRIQLEVDEVGAPAWLEFVSCPTVVRGAVFEAAKTWHHEPLRIEGEARRYTTKIPVLFRLVGAPPREIPEAVEAALPGYPSDAPEPDTLPWLAFEQLTPLAPLALHRQDPRDLQPGQQPSCRATLYIDAEGETFHADVSWCPEKLQPISYEALLDRHFEPPMIDGEPTAVRTSTRFSYPF